MKKMSLIFTLLILKTFVFATSAYAFVTIQDKYYAADRMVNLGIIQGFPDGSLGPEQSFTRAQFARIAMIIKGFNEEDTLRENYNYFRDVAGGQWFTGWINLAYKYEFIKGDPSGHFRPNDTISYQEAITIILRLLGYENLPNHWPTNYLEKAEEIGLIQGVFQGAHLPAPRGDVFVLLNRALDMHVVSWNTQEGKFLPNEAKETLLTEMLKEKKERQLAGQLYYGIAAENPINRGGQWVVKINVAGAGIGEYIVEKRTTLQQGDLVIFKAYSDGEVNILNRLSSSTATRFRDVYKTVGSREGDYIELEPTAEGGSTFWYQFTDDTLIFDSDNWRYTTSLQRSAIKERDRVIVLEENRVLKVILKVNYIR